MEKPDIFTLGSHPLGSRRREHPLTALEELAGDCNYDDVQVYRLAPLARRLDTHPTRLADLPSEARFDRDGWIHATVTQPCYESEARCRVRLDDYDLTVRRQRIAAAQRAASAPWFYVAGGHLRHRTARE